MSDSQEFQINLGIQDIEHMSTYHVFHPSVSQGYHQGQAAVLWSAARPQRSPARIIMGHVGLTWSDCAW